MKKGKQNLHISEINTLRRRNQPQHHSQVQEHCTQSAPPPRHPERVCTCSFRKLRNDMLGKRSGGARRIGNGTNTSSTDQIETVSRINDHHIPVIHNNLATRTIITKRLQPRHHNHHSCSIKAKLVAHFLALEHY